MKGWNEIYKNILSDIFKNGYEDYNKRTKSKVTRLFGVNFKIKNVNYLPALTLRKMYFKTAAAELAWTLSGTRNTSWLNKYTSIWKQFEDDINYISTSYGYRWSHLFGRDQIQDLIQMFKKDPSSRQGVVITWDPHKDGLMNLGKSKMYPALIPLLLLL